MSKNITIREGDTTKQFTAKKLRVNQVGGGTVNFIPEDEAVDYVDLKDHEFKANGTFNPGDFNCDGFGQVKVAVPANVKEKTITKNGVFNASSDNCLGYSKVTVNVPGGGGGGPYTVNFFGDDYETVLKTEANVPYGGSASCTDLDGTILNGLYFKGWNPTPVNVRDNMNCYPERGEYTIGSGEIEDTWETICSNCGAPYAIGAYKSLVFNATSSVEHRFYDDTDHEKYTDVTFNGIGSVSVHMVKVAEGEDGSTSTWLSNIPISTPLFNSYAFQTVQTEQDWENSGTRVYLNEGLFQDLPQHLKDTIKTVTKQTKSAYPRQRAQIKNSVLQSTLDKIWIPSIREISGLLTRWPSVSGGSTDIRTSGNQGRTSSDPTYIQSIIDSEYEVQGIDYCANYFPNWFDYTNYLRFRSIPFPAQYNMNADAIQHNGSFLVVLHNVGNQPSSPFGFCL